MPKLEEEGRDLDQKFSWHLNPRHIKRGGGHWSCLRVRSTLAKDLSSAPSLLICLNRALAASPDLGPPFLLAQEGGLKKMRGAEGTAPAWTEASSTG